MKTAFTTRSVAQVLTFPLHDTRWVNKLLIGVLITIIGPFLLFIPSVFVAGYCVRIMRRIIVDREDPSLPEWDDWQELFVDGCRLTGVGLIYFIPVILLGAAGLSLFILIMIIASGSNDQNSAFAFLTMLNTFMFQGGVMLVMFLSLLTSIVAAGGYAHMAAKGTFGAAFRVGEWWPIFRANLGGFLISFLLIMTVSWVLSMAVQLLIFTLVLCVIVPLGLGVISFYQSLITFALFGMAYREGQDQLLAY